MSIEALYDNPTSDIAQPEVKKDAPVDKPAAFDPSRLYDTKHSDTPAERKDEQQPAQKTDEDRAAVLYSPDSTYADTVLVTDVPANATA